MEKVLRNLKSEKTDWTYYFGTMTQLVGLLAGIVVIAGPDYNLTSLIDAKDKLQEATTVIEKTSINQNYINYETNTTNIFIENANIKQLPEKTETEPEN